MNLPPLLPTSNVPPALQTRIPTSRGEVSLPFTTPEIQGEFKDLTNDHKGPGFQTRSQQSLLNGKAADINSLFCSLILRFWVNCPPACVLTFIYIMQRMWITRQNIFFSSEPPVQAEKQASFPSSPRSRGSGSPFMYMGSEWMRWHAFLRTGHRTKNSLTCALLEDFKRKTHPWYVSKEGRMSLFCKWGNTQLTWFLKV